MQRQIKTYSELLGFKSFKDRFDYLMLGGEVGAETFGHDRYINQVLYHSKAWTKDVRNYVISRDLGCDLAIADMPIYGQVIIHHMNPITKEDIANRSELVLNPEFLVCVSSETHRALHYGSLPEKAKLWEERKPNDTIPWR